MKKNVGGIDKTLRIILGVVILALGVMNSSILGLIGLIPLLTGLISWCPLYVPFGFNTTCKKDDSVQIK